MNPWTLKEYYKVVIPLSPFVDLIKNKKGDVYLQIFTNISHQGVGRKFKITQWVLQEIKNELISKTKLDEKKREFKHPCVSVTKQEAILLALTASTQNAVFCMSRKRCDCHQNESCTVGCRHDEIHVHPNHCSACGDGSGQRSTHRKHVIKNKLYNSKDLLSKVIKNMKADIADHAERVFDQVLSDENLTNYMLSPTQKEMSEYLKTKSRTVLSLASQLDFKDCPKHTVYYTLIDNLYLPCCRHGVETCSMIF